jgi:hypothetical protein
MRDSRDILREYASSARPSLLDEIAREARARHGDHVAVDVSERSASIVDLRSGRTHAREVAADSGGALKKLCARILPARGGHS